jgi:hypothetical protein
MQYKMDLHHAYGHSSWRLICSIDMDWQRRLEHVAWNEHVQCSVHLSMLHVFVHAACLCPCCMSTLLLRVHVTYPCPSTSMLHVPVHAACSYPCCMHIPLLYAHVHAANLCPWWMSMFTSMPHVQVHAACMYMRNGHGLAVWTWECSMWQACRIDRGMQNVHGHAAWHWCRQDIDICRLLLDRCVQRAPLFSGGLQKIAQVSGSACKS